MALVRFVGICDSSPKRAIRADEAVDYKQITEHGKA